MKNLKKMRLLSKLSHRRESSKSLNGWQRRLKNFIPSTMRNSKRRSSTSLKAATQPPTMKTCTLVRLIGRRLPMQTEGKQLKWSSRYFRARTTSATSMFWRREVWLSRLKTLRPRRWNSQALFVPLRGIWASLRLTTARLNVTAWALWLSSSWRE